MANNQNQNQNVNNGNNLPAEAKKNAFQRAGDAAFRKWQNFKTSKVGRWTLRIVKIAAVGGACYASYERGKKDAGEKVVYIQEIQPEDKPAEQAPVNEEPVQEENV